MIDAFILIILALFLLINELSNGFLYVPLSTISPSAIDLMFFSFSLAGLSHWLALANFIWTFGKSIKLECITKLNF
jgi:heme/copper-type cytochrome/quinol oxidase subunit 1